MLVTTHKQFDAALAWLAKSDIIVVDLETTGLKPYHGDRMCGVAVGAGKKTYYFPFRHGDGPNLPMELLPHLMKALSHPDKLYIGFNYKFDLQFMVKDGATLPGKVEDVMIAAHLMNENEPKGGLKLKVLADKYLGEGSSDEQTTLYERLAEMGYKGKGAAGHMWRLPAADVAPYAEQDVKITWGLREFYRPHLKAWKLDTINEEVNEYLLITTGMEMRGLLIDVKTTREYMEEALTKVEPMRQELVRLAGYDINPNSSKQLQSLLGVGSVAADVLEVIATMDHKPYEQAVAKTVLDYKGWAKVNSTYYSKYLASVDEENVLRTSLHITGTVTGRFSSSDPNLQQVPQYNNVYKVKDVFVARPGYVLVSADYSQAELRLATHYTQDPPFIDIFQRNADAHQMTADMCGITRREGKTINFGIIYGLGAGNIILEKQGKDPGGLASQLGIPVAEARVIIGKYHKQFPGFKVLYRRCETMGRERGYIRMWTGRVRRYGPTSPPHKAMPNLIQGGTGEIMRVTITKLHRALAHRDVHMLLQIHDQIIFEVPEAQVGEIVPTIVKIMEDHQFRVPMKVDVSVGKAWGKLKEWELN